MMDTVRLKVEERDDRRPGAVQVDEAGVARLIERAADGDSGALGEIYGMYLDRIYRYIVYQIEDRMMAEDLTEEVFLKAWKGLKAYRGNVKAFPTWLYRIAHNQVVDHWRGKAREAHLNAELHDEMKIAVDGPEQQVEENALQQELLEAVCHLPPQQGQVIILKFIEGMDTCDVARIMKKSQGAVRVLQMRALSALRVKISEGEIGAWRESYQRC